MNYYWIAFMIAETDFVCRLSSFYKNINAASFFFLLKFLGIFQSLLKHAVEKFQYVRKEEGWWPLLIITIRVVRMHFQFGINQNRFRSPKILYTTKHMPVFQNNPENFITMYRNSIFMYYARHQQSILQKQFLVK